MIHPKEYAAALYESVRGLSDKEAQRAVSEFSRLMAKRGLMALLPGVLRDLPNEARRIDGIEVVTVEVAHDIEPEVAERAARLVTADDQPIEVEVKVRPELIGGIRVRGRDTVYDASLLNRLVTLKEKFVRSS